MFLSGGVWVVKKNRRAKQTERGLVRESKGEEAKAVGFLSVPPIHPPVFVQSDQFGVEYITLNMFFYLVRSKG